MRPLLWRLIYHAVRALADSEPALWRELHRGIVGVARSPDPEEARRSLRRIVAAIAAAHGPTDRPTP